MIIFYLLIFSSFSLAVTPKPLRSNTSGSFDMEFHQVKKNIDRSFPAIISKKKSNLSKNNKKKATQNPLGIRTFKPNYIFPLYYTDEPYQSIYEGQTPNDQRINNYEMKYQLSLKVPVWHKMFGLNSSLNIAYTQMSYWQFYTESQYFRETDYEGEVFINYNFAPHWFLMPGIVHQSNGKGIPLERSWNRVYTEMLYSDGHFMLSVKPWVLVFERYSSDLHNSDIRHYMGNGLVRAAYKFHQVVLAVMVRNELESQFSRGAEQGTISFPLFNKIRGYVEVFSGYGQSLLEYNHYTNAVGLGISFNDWL